MESKKMKTGVNPDPMLQFIFAMFAVLNVISIFCNLFPDDMYVIAVLEFSLGIGAFVGSILNLKRGDPHGNINLILSVILGFAGGITEFAVAYSYSTPRVLNPRIMSVILLLGGIYMLCFLPLLGSGPLYVWISHASVILGFFCTSLANLLGIPFLKPLGGVFLSIFAITAIYQGITSMYAQYGKSLPQGPKACFWKKG